MNNEFDKNRDCTKEYTTFPIAVLLKSPLLANHDQYHISKVPI